MRVLVIAANQEQKPDPVVPLGAAFVAGAARDAGHDVRMFDACFLGEKVLPELINTLRQFQPDVVGMSIRNIDDVCWPQGVSYLPYYRKLGVCIRAVAQDARFVLGGSAFTLMPTQFMRAIEPDHGVAGEGEGAFVSLLATLEAGELPPRLLRAEPAGFPSTHPALDLLDIDQYYQRGGALNVQTRRGCSFLCTYCTYPVLEGRHARRRAVCDTVDELESGLLRYGAKHFFVVDNTFNHPTEHAAEFCEELLRRELNVRWTAYVTPAGMTEELLRLMARAGCGSVEYGTDAASEVTLGALGKSFGIPEIVHVSDWSRRAGLKFAHTLILGGPDETPATMAETVAVMEKVNPTAVFAMLGVRLYPNTQLARRAEREGLIAEAEIGIEPVFYVSESVAPTLEESARALAASHSNWFFPGLEGERWTRFWHRRRTHGIRGPLWEWMGQATADPAHEVIR
ncbi:MAG: cobalamin B12-binding domain-containing protein [Planctomycetes bacterium]|nr:cobalamin B12-binding domain-containing protein [Planctomycetota bacterium]